MKCPQCQKDKDIEEFRRLTGLQDKFNKLCRSCIEPRKAKYVRKRPKTDTKTHRKDEAMAKEGYKICTGCEVEKGATLEFFHKLKKGRGGLNARCKTCENDKTNGWRKENPEKVKLSSRNTQIKRKDKINAYCRDRYKTDMFFRARANTANRVREIMKNGEQYSITIGCSGEQLKIHLESLFQPGMTWENYGEWHIDHKYPLSVAYKEGRESFQKACHYTNLQPLWAKDNRRKGNKIA